MTGPTPLDRLLIAAAGRFEVVSGPDGFTVRGEPVDLTVQAALTAAVAEGLLGYADDDLTVETFVLPTLAATPLIVNGDLS
jgi:hypothetical protein